MAKDIALGMIIGGAVGASLGRSFSDVKGKVDDLQRKTNSARMWRNVIRETTQLRQEFQKLHHSGSDAADGIRKKIEGNLTALRAAGFEVDKLDKQYKLLGRTVRGLDLQAAGRERIGRGVEQTKSAMADATKFAAAIAVPAKISANYQATVRDIAIKGGIARTADEDMMATRIHGIAKSSGMGSNDLAAAVNELVAGGMDVPQALDLAPALARFSVSQAADQTDTARLILSLRQSGISDPKKVEQMLGSIAVAGDLGSFEAKDMAKHFSSLLPNMTAYGMSGERGTVALATMLQTQMRGAGSADEAAVNLANLLSKITADDTKRKFAEQGINLEGSMQSAILKGYDPVSAFLSLTEKTMARQDPAKAREMAKMQERIAKAQDPAEAQKLIDGYLSMSGLTELISDRQAKQAALIAIQNKKLTADNLKSIQTTDGLSKVEKDLADRRAASREIWREVGYSWERTMTEVGNSIRPVTDAIGVSLTMAGDAMSYVAKMAPMFTNALVGITGGIIGYKMLRGVGNIARGGFDLARGKFLARGGLGRMLGGALGGKSGGVGGALDAALGGAGIQKVFVVNMPGSGFGLGDLAPDAGGKPGGKAGGRGRLGRLGGAVRGGLVRTAGLVGLGGSMGTALAAPSLSAIGGAGAGAVASSAGAVLASGAAGYAVGTVLKHGIDEGLALATGDKEATLGFKMFDWFSGKDDEVRKMLEAPVPMPGRKEAAPASVQRQETFSPTVTLNVNGDVKDPRDLAREVMKQMQSMYPEFARTLDPLYDSHHL